MRKENGAITLFVLIVCTIFISILLLLNIGIISKNANQEKELDGISKNYEVTKEDMERTYLKALGQDTMITVEDVQMMIEEAKNQVREEYKAEMQSQIDNVKKEMNSTIEKQKEEMNTTIENLKKEMNTTTETIKSQAKLEAFPVGSIFISTTSTNPSSYIGGTWQSYGEGRTLLSSSGASEQTGGANTVTLTTDNIPSHTHAYDKPNSNTNSHVLTASETPKELVRLAYVSSGWSLGSWDQHGTGYIATMRDQPGYGGYGLGHTHGIQTTSTQTSATGGGKAINIQNSYITVHIWKRTK